MVTANYKVYWRPLGQEKFRIMVYKYMYKFKFYHILEKTKIPYCIDLCINKHFIWYKKSCYCSYKALLLLCRLAVFHYRDCVKWTKASFVSTSNIFLCWICTYYSLINDSNLLLVMSLVLPISYLEMPLFQIDCPSVHIIYFQCITHSTDVTIALLLCISLLSPIKWTEKWSFLKIWQNLVVVRICERLGCWTLSEMSIDVF